jgi:hypothetical protein
MLYHLKAYLLCHDVRLNSWVETVVVLQEASSQAAASLILWACMKNIHFKVCSSTRVSEEEKHVEHR